MPFVSRSRPKRPARGRLLREGGAVSLSDAWRAWLAENVALGVANADLVSALVENGVPPAMALREVEAVRRSPLTLAARRLALRLRRHDFVARLHREVASLGRDAHGVERRAGVSADEFFDRYYAAQVPLVLTDATAPWPGLRQWSPQYFRERFGEREVEVMMGRDADPLCDTHFDDFRAKTRLRDFCDRVTSTAPTNDFYLAAHNRSTNGPALRELLEDVALPHPYLESRPDDCGWTSLWFGPPGTVTPLHHDTANVFFCQVYGRKRFRILSPFELGILDGIRHGAYSSFDADAFDPAQSPAPGGALVREVVLSPGEALFLPVGYWHQVRALDVSISLACTAFRRPNHFDWYYPGGPIGLPR
jgi:hypothetical protein